MAAMGQSWAPGSWADDVWADGSWAPAVPAVFEDLTTLFCVYVWETLRDETDGEDVNTLIEVDLPDIRALGNNDDDLNTNYAEVLST